tara:strand:+ start:1636 stop:2349 length:714 start_codon:yes stop_codon:yes gene_type:complete
MEKKLYHSKKILGIIPARGNSKGIKNKNLKLINGKPLIYYTINRAKKSKLISDLIGSTDSKKIEKYFINFGVKVPFNRPNKLAGDRSNIIDTLIYSVEKMELIKNIKYDYVCLLQPTSPLRKKNEIDNAIRKIIKYKADTFLSLSELDDPHPYKLMKIKNNKLSFFKKNFKGTMNRQMMSKLFKPTGNIYIINRDTLKKKTIYGKKSIYSLVDQKYYLNINNYDDLILAKEKLKKLY